MGSSFAYLAKSGSILGVVVRSTQSERGLEQRRSSDLSFNRQNLSRPGGV